MQNNQANTYNDPLECIKSTFTTFTNNFGNYSSGEVKGKLEVIISKDIQHTQKENENTNYEMIKEEEKK